MVHVVVFIFLYGDDLRRISAERCCVSSTHSCCHTFFLIRILHFFHIAFLWAFVFIWCIYVDLSLHCVSSFLFYILFLRAFVYTSCIYVNLLYILFQCVFLFFIFWFSVRLFSYHFSTCICFCILFPRALLLFSDISDTIWIPITRPKYKKIWKKGRKLKLLKKKTRIFPKLYRFPSFNSW